VIISRLSQTETEKMTAIQELARGSNAATDEETLDTFDVYQDDS
jgi:hypothetical protein